MFLELWSLSLPKSIMNATGQDFLKMNKVVLTFNFVDEVLGRGGGGGGGWVGRVLHGIRGGGVPPSSPNPDPISDQNMPLSIPVFRPDMYVNIKGPNYVNMT